MAVEPKAKISARESGALAVEGLARAVQEHGDACVKTLSVADLKAAIYEKGLCSIKSAFPAAWVQQLREEYEPLMQEARSRHGGTISRGPNRFYHQVHPEKLSGFVDLVTHPMVTALCEAVLGKRYQIVELGFDCPLPGAKNQPWHRDFPIGTESEVGHWLSSLAFNMTTVDVTEEMGAFEIAYGTHWEDGAGFGNGMFPPKESYSRYEQVATRCFPKQGDMSCRTGLTVHRGTEHKASIPRPVLILGVVADTILPVVGHRLVMTKTYFDRLPETVKPHLKVELVEALAPITQEHDIEGLRYESE